jgi:hypothetical protein
MTANVAHSEQDFERLHSALLTAREEIRKSRKIRFEGMDQTMPAASAS